MTLIKRIDYVGTSGTSYHNGVPVTEVQGGGHSQIEWGGNHSMAQRFGPGDSGTVMLLTRDITNVRWGYVKGDTQNYGNFHGSTSFSFSDNLPNRTDLQVKAQGTTAIARTTPNTPAFSLPTMLGETVKDGLPHLIGHETWKDQTLTAKNTSGELLNYEFGWLPLVSDVRNFARAVKNSSKIIADFKKGSGKNIRVGYEFPPDSYSGSDTRGSIATWAGGGLTGGAQTSSYSVSASRRTWFKGAFSYHLPVGNTKAAEMQRFGSYANKLLGVRLTPEVLWNLAPWTWAADWFGNTGDIIHNVSSMGHDGLVLRYGYVMYHARRSSTWQVSFKSPLTGSSSTTNISETKKRFAATPYFGFGASGALNATQSAVLVALGINHMR